MVKSLDDAVGTLRDALAGHFLADSRAVTPQPTPAFDPAKYRPDRPGDLALPPQCQD